MSDLPARFLASLTSSTSLGLAVSGGGDSVALLHLAVACGLQPAVVTVNHGLRAEAASEAAQVAGVAAALGLSHETLLWQGWDHTGNLQDAARKARRRLISAWALQNNIASVALGHTQNDIAETFLMRLQRGAGVDGLAKMAGHWSEGGILWQRPLLGFTRNDLRLWLQAQGNVADLEMYKTFNCGIGMAVIVAEEHAAAAMDLLTEAGESVFHIGQVRAQKAGEAPTLVV